MAKQLDKIIVVDVEATCWKGKIPTGTHSDIIEVGITRALDILGLPLEGRHHSGRDDAWNIAKIMWTMLCTCRDNEV
jgi:inhibitor of KinA sporulation pathway (predicted exonuclease)